MCMCVRACVHACTRVQEWGERRIQYYDYIILIFEVSVFAFLLIL